MLPSTAVASVLPSVDGSETAESRLDRLPLLVQNPPAARGKGCPPVFTGVTDAVSGWPSRNVGTLFDDPSVPSICSRQRRRRVRQPLVLFSQLMCSTGAVNRLWQSVRGLKMNISAENWHVRRREVIFNLRLLTSSYLHFWEMRGKKMEINPGQQANWNQPSTLQTWLSPNSGTQSVSRGEFVQVEGAMSQGSRHLSATEISPEQQANWKQPSSLQTWLSPNSGTQSVSRGEFLQVEGATSQGSRHLSATEISPGQQANWKQPSSLQTWLSPNSGTQSVSRAELVQVEGANSQGSRHLVAIEINPGQQSSWRQP
ncbi:hypothetical protein B0H14DRAFT_2589094 [Mycena olivaceomarginata]|nr:hypothetical protein B0H14DRAFT_2589094 [Mycena olivaceomarginata]